jgi:hypothetical protein
LLVIWQFVKKTFFRNAEADAALERNQAEVAAASSTQMGNDSYFPTKRLNRKEFEALIREVAARNAGQKVIVTADGNVTKI